MVDINALLKIVRECNASDLHLKTGTHPIIRINGELRPLTDLPRLSPMDTQSLTDQLVSSYQKKSLENDLDIDLAYEFPNLGRFRVSIFHQRGTLALALRFIPLKIRNIRELLLPPVLENIALEERGLVLVTGTTGTGKSTTLAGMIDHINVNRRKNIITIEDPIEYLHSDKMSVISQREVGADVKGFSRGLRSALREDPDVILVGEMRDLDTIETAILAAETGHLVMSTLHTLDARETINRIISVFPPYHQRQIRIQLAGILKSIISMRLIPKKDRTGRVPAVEVMINTPYIEECIMAKEKTSLIRDAIAAGVSQYGMQSFDQSIYFLYKHDFISFEQGLKYSSSPDNFKLRVSGVQSTLDIALHEMEEKLGLYEPEEKDNAEEE
ncbi:MAG: PilT/PilU family type 4a pilus ATPase [Candidatus Aminicenantes bacterium]|nr:PilT/PilU family type 4a pilus ATPase [Candidatus Aminicenantes bacterium]